MDNERLYDPGVIDLPISKPLALYWGFFLFFLLLLRFLFFFEGFSVGGVAMVDFDEFADAHGVISQRIDFWIKAFSEAAVIGFLSGSFLFCELMILPFEQPFPGRRWTYFLHDSCG